MRTMLDRERQRRQIRRVIDRLEMVTARVDSNSRRMESLLEQANGLMNELVGGLGASGTPVETVAARFASDKEIDEEGTSAWMGPVLAIAEELFESDLRSASIPEIITRLGFERDKVAANRVGRCLRRAGWERFRPRNEEGKREWRYRPTAVVQIQNLAPVARVRKPARAPQPELTLEGVREAFESFGSDEILVDDLNTKLGLDPNIHSLHQLGTLTRELPWHLMVDKNRRRWVRGAPTAKQADSTPPE